VAARYGRPLDIPAASANFLPVILVIDNYDSFTYNLVQYLGEMRVALEVRRNDQISIAQIHEMNPERILISPAPVRRASPACPTTSSAPLGRGCRSSGFAWAISASATPSARKWWSITA